MNNENENKDKTFKERFKEIGHNLLDLIEPIIWMIVVLGGWSLLGFILEYW